LVYGDRAFLEEVFGVDVVKARLQERLDYATRRVALFAAERPAFFRHVELDQWIEIFADPMLPLRHLANAAGKTVFAPYAAGPMLRACRSVPLQQRYIWGLQPKYLLKRTLQRRLPAYPIGQRKLHTALPFERYFRKGPLTGIWDRYDIPAVFRGAARDRLVSAADWTTWNAVTWAIWERVVADPDLAPLEESRQLTWGSKIAQGHE
jgi:hypothetical protein